MSPLADLDVVVPCHGQADRTVALVGSVVAARPAVALRLVVVDNGSPPADLARVRAALAASGLPHRVFEVGENLGFVKGTNLGLAAATAPYVCLQNNDTRVYPGTYERLLAHAAAWPDLGAVGPVTSPGTGWQGLDHLASAAPVFAADGDLAAAPDADRARGLAARHGGEVLGVGGMVAFFCAVLPRAAISRVGYLSEAFGAGLGDDDDWCLRARRAGLRLLLACDAYAAHDHRTTFRALYSAAEIAAMQDRAYRTLARRAGG